MILRGKLFAESPIYRGNARKTLFTRDGDGTQRLVSLAGEIEGTAQSLMDAFVGKSRDGKNIGLLNQIWLRLYDAVLPEGLIKDLDCRLCEECYARDHFFDLRMGIKLDEDRFAAEANANYKMETLFRNSMFNLTLNVDEGLLKKDENTTRLYYVLQELKAGRFWFGAGKSKGLGRCRLEMEIPFSVPKTGTSVSKEINHLTISLSFNADNPILVGWNWGKVDPAIPAFKAVEGRLLVESMRVIPEAIRKRLEMSIGGPILSPENFKKRFAEYLPKVAVIWLMENSSGEKESWMFPVSTLAKLGKGKFAMSEKLLDRVRPLGDQIFPTREAAVAALNEALGAKADKGKRFLDILQCKKQAGYQLNQGAWLELANSLGLDKNLAGRLEPEIQNEAKLINLLADAMQKALPRFYQIIDQQICLLQSDQWIEQELTVREEHLLIKNMLLEEKINEDQWGNPDKAPLGIRPGTWKEFLDAHKRVRFQHMVNYKNLLKSITNDKNYIAFIKDYRNRTRQELAQPYNTDFRTDGPSGREVSRKYGKPYDTVFMRMLAWSPSCKGDSSWEVYIPGSTIKGAFRKRAAQILKTLWGESSKTDEILNELFGAQRKRGLIFFSDAYLKQTSEKNWGSMDGVRMNPKTGAPIEEAKADYLYACGKELVFDFRLDIQDLDEQDKEALSLFSHLLQDFQRGDIPLGGEKTCGLGWVKGDIVNFNWDTSLSSKKEEISKKLFGGDMPGFWIQEGIWWKLYLEGKTAGITLQGLSSLISGDKKISQRPPRANQGFISHRSFGGHCGVLDLKAKILTPIFVQESGEPSFRSPLIDNPNEVVNGWDFFSKSAPVAELRDHKKTYALPSKSIKGMIRHLYSITSDSSKESPDLSRLNPTDSLFGFVGTGPNQALMGRLSFSFGLFDKPDFSWFKVAYPYGSWHYIDGKWQQTSKKFVDMNVVDQNWRIFPNAPLAPIVKKLDDFKPDTYQANYSRSILPDSECTFSIRFWNLEKEELQRLIWCLILEDKMAHKMGKHRYLGFGSLRFQLLPSSYLIEWSNRYAKKDEKSWQLPIDLKELTNPSVIKHYQQLKKSLNAEQL
ncbi:MAG: RAMP superfamily CRISPR-associated protein [bacterium]